MVYKNSIKRYGPEPPLHYKSISHSLRIYSGVINLPHEEHRAVLSLTAKHMLATDDN